MELEVLKKMSKEDLRLMLADQSEELRKMRFKSSQRQLKNIRKIRETKKTIAQISTILAQ